MAAKHWTQTPEGRAKMSRYAKARIKKHGAFTNGTIKPQASSADIPSDTLAYAYGRIEAWIETYAASAHVSSATLAFRLGQLLQRKARR